MREKLIKKYNQIKYFKLISAIVIDLGGLATYVLPVFGEGGDFVWGPISGLLIFMLFPNRKGKVVGGIIEEMLPITDFIPTAYMAWRLDYVRDREITLAKYLKHRLDEEKLITEILKDVN